MEAAVDDIEFLISSAHRVAVLDALNDGACDRDDLRASTGASSPTMGRVLTDFQDRHWIEREGSTYRLTSLGRYVAVELMAFRDAMSHQRQLRDIWPWLPHEIDGFDLDTLDDIVVSRPGTGFPYEPIQRVNELISASDTMRGFGMPMLKSGNLEPFFQSIQDGLECDYIYPTPVFDELLSWDEETVEQAAIRPNYNVFLHDELPLGDRCGICLLDDRVSICCVEPETQTLRSLVDTGSEELRAWAESSYQRFRDEARPLEERNRSITRDSMTGSE